MTKLRPKSRTDIRNVKTSSNPCPNCPLTHVHSQANPLFILSPLLLLSFSAPLIHGPFFKALLSVSPPILSISSCPFLTPLRCSHHAPIANTARKNVTTPQMVPTMVLTIFSGATFSLGEEITGYVGRAV